MNSSAKLIIFPPIRKIFLKKLGTSTFLLCFQDYSPKNLGKYLLVSENNTTFAHRNTDESDTGRAGLVNGNLRYTAVTDLC